MAFRTPLFRSEWKFVFPDQISVTKTVHSKETILLTKWPTSSIGAGSKIYAVTSI